MKQEEGRLEGEEEADLFWQAWLPDSDPRAAVVIAHGVSEHSGRYSHVGERLAAAGYAVYAVDHRGHGRSGEGAIIDRFDFVVEDLRAFVDLAAGRHPDLKVYLLGHSMGGAISIGYAVRYQENLAGLILTGAVADPRAAGVATRVISRVLSALTPGLGIYGVDASAVSKDPKVVRDYEADPLNHHGKIPARTVNELVSSVSQFGDQVPAIRIPLLILHGGADTLTPVAGSRMVNERAGSEDKTLKIFDGLYHEILNEPEQGEVMDQIVAWLDARV